VQLLGHALLTNGERTSGVESICRLPENSVLPVVFAVQLMAMKADGSSAEEIDQASAALRAIVAKGR
jgi:hypothetical protein